MSNPSINYINNPIIASKAYSLELIDHRECIMFNKLIKHNLRKLSKDHKIKSVIQSNGIIRFI